MNYLWTELQAPVAALAVLFVLYVPYQVTIIIINVYASIYFWLDKVHSLELKLH